MPSNPFMTAIMALAILNGIFSPFFVVTAQVMLTAMLPPLLLAGASFIAFFGSLIAATATIMLAGVPTAIFERVTGRKTTDSAAYSIWLVTIIVISFPGLARAISMLF